MSQDGADAPKTVVACSIVLHGEKFKISAFRVLTDEENLIEETERKMIGQETYEVGPEEHGVKFTPRVDMPIRKEK